MKSGWFRRYWYWLLIAVIILIVGIFISIFRTSCVSTLILNFFDDWSVALGAGAAVILAVTAFRTIKEANKREERRRQDELEREKRESIDRDLREIIDWAEAICEIVLNRQLKIEAPAKSEAEARLRFNSLVFKEMKELAGLFEAMIVKSKRISSRASMASKIDPMLGVKVHVLSRTLTKHIKSLSDLGDEAASLTDAEINQSTKDMTKEFDVIQTLATDTIEVACNIKI